MIITLGQFLVDLETGTIADDDAALARQSLENVKAIIPSAELSVVDIMKTKLFVKNLNDFATVNATYVAFCSEHYA